MDWGNFSGSILMLAMLDPVLFATPQVHRLSIFGAGLLQLGTATPRSGHGPDNMRTNSLEAILNYLQAFPAQVYLRQLLLRTWRLVRLAACHVHVSSKLPHERAQRVVLCQDERLPCGDITDRELIDYENVMVLSEDARLRLSELPSGSLPRYAIAELVGFSKDSQVVKIIQNSLYQCGIEGAHHGGNLHILLFASARTAAAPPLALRVEAAKVKEQTMLAWLGERRSTLTTREGRFKEWKQLMIQFHPDKRTYTEEERQSIEARCSFLREAKAWFIG
jgi:hypothetical protein